jgi:hypothetical protein
MNDANQKPDLLETDCDQRDAGAGYEPPRLTVLGTLADLTAGGTVGEFDGSGEAGASGSIP